MINRTALIVFCTPNEETALAKIVSLVVKVGALAFIIFLPLKYAIVLQLLGGIWILETFPAIICGLFTRWFHHWALFCGWLAGMVTGTAMVAVSGFKSPIYTLHIGDLSFAAYAAVFALIVNLAVAMILTPLFDGVGMKRLTDVTAPEDYEEEAGNIAEQVKSTPVNP